MSLYYRSDTGDTYADFDTLRQAGMTMLGQMERQLARSAQNGRPLTPGQLGDFQDLVAHYRRWWASLQEKPSPAVVRAFKIAKTSSPPT